MSETTIKNLADAINHNADLLEKHLEEGVFVHRQNTASKVWSIRHHLGSLRPLVETYDSRGNRIGHGIDRSNQTFDSCDVIFAVPMSGTAILRF